MVARRRALVGVLRECRRKLVFTCLNSSGQREVERNASNLHNPTISRRP
jgi:hypothetical protein